LGGSIGLTVRKKDGAEYRMERWTNITPSIFYDPNFWNGDEHVIDEVIEHWEIERKKMWRGKTLISSWHMYENPYLAPSEYGVIVVDYKTMSIVSCQGYLAINRIMSIEPQFKTLKEAGLIGKEVCPELHEYKIRTKCWKIKTIREGNWKKAKKEIEALGFVLTKKEEELWQEKIDEDL
jgi:hypothetical protein